MDSNHYKLLLFFLNLTIASAGRIYVSQSNTTPPCDGQSWSTAFPKLTQALAIAEYGDSIWLAEGTYFPAAGTDRDATFELKPGVQVYGGFWGWEIEMDLDSPFAPTCPSRFDGGFAVTAAGIPPYNYELTALDIGFVINADFNSLIEGDYQLVVTDSSLCQDTLLIGVPAADSISIESTVTHATADEGGAIEITGIQNGTPPFQYEWSNGDTTTLISDLLPGVYNLTVSDSTNCQSTFSFTVDLSNGLQPSDSQMEIAVFPNPATSWLQLFSSLSICFRSP